MPDFGGALAWLMLWRAKAPDDLAGVQAQVRLLSRAGRAQEAEALAERTLAGTAARDREPVHCNVQR